MVESQEFTQTVYKNWNVVLGVGKNDHQLESPKINSIKSCPQM